MHAAGQAGADGRDVSALLFRILSTAFSRPSQEHGVRA